MTAPTPPVAVRIEGQESNTRADRAQALLHQAVRAHRHAARRHTATVHVAQVAVVVAILGSWELTSRAGLLDNADLFYGSPTGVARFLSDNWSHLWINTRATLWAVLLGFLIGAALGVAAGLVLARLQTLARIVDPIFTVLFSLPRIALAPLFLLWFGIGLEAKLAVSVSGVFFVVLYNTLAGARSVDRDIQTVAGLLGARSFELFSKVVLPASVPVIFAGLRLAMVYSLLSTIASEMVAARTGLGLDIVRYGQTLTPNGVFAVLAILAVISAAANGALRAAEARFLRWSE